MNIDTLPYIDDLPDHFDEFEDFLSTHFKINIDKEFLIYIVEMQQILQNIHYGNLRAEVVFDILKENLESEYGVECSFFINAIDTQFYINGDSVYSADDILNCIQN